MTLEADGIAVSAWSNATRREPQLEFIFSIDLVTIRTTYYTDDLWSEIEDSTEQTTNRESFEQCVRDAINLIETTILRAIPTAGAAWLARQKGG